MRCATPAARRKSKELGRVGDIVHSRCDNCYTDFYQKASELKNSSDNALNSNALGVCSDCLHGMSEHDEFGCFKAECQCPTIGMSKLEKKAEKKSGGDLDNTNPECPECHSINAHASTCSKYVEHIKALKEKENALGYCQGCGKNGVELTPLQDPQSPKLRGAVRRLCASCVPDFERDGWSKNFGERGGDQEHLQIRI